MPCAGDELKLCGKAGERWIDGKADSAKTALNTLRQVHSVVTIQTPEKSLA